MEKNQHNSGAENNNQQGRHHFEENQPGQQLPAGANNENSGQTLTDVNKEQHSESSFPQQEGETLGTP